MAGADLERCLLCGGEAPERWKTPGARFRRCRSCGFVRGVAAGSAAAEGYALDRGHALPGIERAKRRTARHYLPPPAGAGEPLLDVGCSTGATLLEAAALGYVPWGVEPNAESAAAARRALPGAAIHAGTLSSARFPDASFSVVTAFDVLEHLPDPAADLRELFRVLRPGGRLVAVTPDAGSLSLRLLGARWPHLFAEHVSLFTRGNLERLLGEAGFRGVTTGWAPKWVALETLVRHARIHRHVAMAGLVDAAGRAIPSDLVVPFNVGEMHVRAVRP